MHLVSEVNNSHDAHYLHTNYMDFIIISIPRKLYSDELQVNGTTGNPALRLSSVELSHEGEPSSFIIDPF